ncbi:MAG TPA: hypothetical protein VEA59_06195 [Patescibacteria group bacterium]|nr:hypothetical protein [Patescibacteria group bacterium]
MKLSVTLIFVVALFVLCGFTQQDTLLKRLKVPVTTSQYTYFVPGNKDASGEIPISLNGLQRGSVLHEKHERRGHLYFIHTNLLVTHADTMFHALEKDVNINNMSTKRLGKVGKVVFYATTDKGPLTELLPELKEEGFRLDFVTIEETYRRMSPHENLRKMPASSPITQTLTGEEVLAALEKHWAKDKGKPIAYKEWRYETYRLGKP